jgi:hypothetical protein
MHFFSTLTVVGLILMSIGLSAQQKCYLGIQGGGWQGNIEIHGALQGELQTSASTSYLLEAAYVRRGNPFLNNRIPSNFRYVHSVLSYSEVNLLMKYGITAKGMRFFALFGPSVSRGLRFTSDYKNEAQTYIRDQIDWKKAELNPWEFGGYFGCGFEWLNNHGQKLHLNFRYYLGFTDIDLMAGKQIFNQGALLGIGFSVPLNRS